jgi:hypothetical protein
VPKDFRAFVAEFSEAGRTFARFTSPEKTAHDFERKAGGLRAKKTRSISSERKLDARGTK